jgi:hypothetical protein
MHLQLMKDEASRQLMLYRAGHPNYSGFLYILNYFERKFTVEETAVVDPGNIKSKYHLLTNLSGVLLDREFWLKSQFIFDNKWKFGSDGRRSLTSWGTVPS